MCELCQRTGGSLNLHTGTAQCPQVLRFCFHCRSSGEVTEGSNQQRRPLTKTQTATVDRGPPEERRGTAGCGGTGGGESLSAVHLILFLFPLNHPSHCLSLSVMISQCSQCSGGVASRLEQLVETLQDRRRRADQAVRLLLQQDESNIKTQPESREAEFEVGDKQLRARYHGFCKMF